MAEFGYGYHTEFDEPTPLAYEDLGIPEFSKPGAKPTRADADVANLLSKLPLKDGTIDFNIDLGTNTGSDISKAIDPTKQVNFIATILNQISDSDMFIALVGNSSLFIKNYLYCKFPLSEVEYCTFQSTCYKCLVATLWVCNFHT